jgi:mono/diheme cytochrome c family protein
MAASRRLVILIGAISLFLGCINRTPKHGKSLYQSQCANCHGEKGEGLQQLIPSIRANSGLTANNISLPCLIRYGIADTTTSDRMAMPGLPHLNDVEIANIINYIVDNMQPGWQKITPAEVRDKLRRCTM